MVIKYDNEDYHVSIKDQQRLIGKQQVYDLADIRQLKSQVKKNDMYAQYFLGTAYHQSQGVERNYVLAAMLWEKAAVQGHMKAQYNLGSCYENAHGVTKCAEKAAYWWGKSAKQGFDRAQFSIGSCYETGFGVLQSYKKAIKWYKLSAKQGNMNAQLNLGVCYSMGRGVSRDFEENRKLIKKCRKQVTEETDFETRLCLSQFKVYHCKVCYKEDTHKKFKMCSKCRGALYCSEICQRNDWQRHKPYCKENRKQKK